jgi:hypothetical protein
MPRSKKLVEDNDGVEKKTVVTRKGARNSARSKAYYRPAITDLEIEFCLLVLRGSGNVDETDEQRIAWAARMAGMEESAGRRVWNRKPVREYADNHRRRMAEVLAQMEARLHRKSIGKAEILAHLDRLASIDPERTKGTITGQVGAMMQASSILGLNIAPKDPDELFKGRSLDEIKEYARTGKFARTIEGNTVQ